tara:strand:+ start:194 stop:1114 length:921 start_codon:yes stop_codon:yes gene_type:complete
MKVKVLSILFCSFFFKLFSQDTLLPIVQLDDVIISEEKNGFSVEDFIYYVKNDTTFYKGFKHLRYFKHNYTSRLNLYNKKDKKIGFLNRKGIHYSDSNKAWVIDDSVSYDGKIYKRNGDYKYYTTQAFDDVFFPYDTVNVSLNISKKKNRDESQDMKDAKTIGFSIGTDNVKQSKGGANKRFAIFDIEMQKYYDYIISDTVYLNRPCYIFTVRVKDNLSKKDKEKALVRKVLSYFDKENFNVIYREYKFVYNNWFIDLDMRVTVYLDYIDQYHVPTKILYEGFWKVLFFKKEKADFDLELYNYCIY